MIDGLTYDYCPVNDCDGFSFGQNDLLFDRCHFKTRNWENFESLDYKSKEKWLFDKILSNDSFGVFDDKSWLQSLATTVENEWDVLPEGRNKVIKLIFSNVEISR